MQPLLESRPMENDNEAHSTPVKTETLDETLSVFHLVVPESGCGNLDLPPSPPPLPLVSESVPEIHDEYQITDEPPLKKQINMHQKPDQSIQACKIEVETVPLVSGTPDPHGVEQMDAGHMDLNCSDDEVSDRSPAEIALQDAPSGSGETTEAAQGDFGHIKGPRRLGQTNVKNKRLHGKSCKIHQRSMARGRKQPSSSKAYPDGPGITPSQERLLATTFSDLLWTAHCQHRVRLASEGSTELLTVRHHRTGIPYNTAYQPALQALGLYQIARMTYINCDAALITGLVERWRPETHTFHLPFGEMTVTLEDVSCLWGLPIQGKPISGVSDGNFGQMLQDLLGIGPDDPIRKKRKKGDNMKVSEYHLSLKALRERFRELPHPHTQEQLQRYTRAYILDLFGSVMFADNTGDCVPLMYLQFLKDLEEPPHYNWGGAVLAYLYRQLCTAIDPDIKSIAGPVVLLQHWSWTRLPVCRPRARRGWQPAWGSPDKQTCPAFGAKWSCHHSYVDTPHGGTSGVAYVRNQLQLLTDDLVDWRPYEEQFNQLCRQTHNDKDYWRVRTPLIHFWIVEWHYPNRVMRQFNFQQLIPPALPEFEDVTRQLHKLTHGAKGRDWSAHHATACQRAMNPWANDYIEEVGAFSLTDVMRYRAWFQMNCMHTVYLFGMHVEGLRHLIPFRTDERGRDGYIPSGSPIIRMALRAMRGVAHAIKLIKTKGWKKMGKDKLMDCAGSVEDAGFEGRLHAMLRDAELPRNWRDISSDESTEAETAPYPLPPTFEAPDPVQHWLYSPNGWQGYWVPPVEHGAQDEAPAYQPYSQPTVDDPSLSAPDIPYL